MNRLQKYTKASVSKAHRKLSKRLPIGLMRISKAAKKLQTLISFSSARISKNAFGSLAGNSIRRDDHLRGARSKSRNSKSRSSSRGCRRENPSPIIVPCHRVIGKDKSLTGHGGGFDVKNICSHTNSAPISKIYLLATAQGALLDRHNKNFRSCNGT